MFSPPGPMRPTSFGFFALVLLSSFHANSLFGEDGEDSDRKYKLQSSWAVGEATRAKVALEVGGFVTFRGKDKVQRVPMSVVARLEYDEKLLSSEQASGKDAAPKRRSIRSYQTAKAAIKFEKSAFERSLEAERRLMVVDLDGQQATLFSPLGALTRDQLDLVSVVGNTLLIDQLLPENPVAVGEKWSLRSDVIGVLLGLDATGECDVESVLTDVSDGIARMTLGGIVHGAAEGVSTELEVKAKYHYDTKRRRITAINLAVKEKRSIGHVGPGLDVVAKLSVTLKPAGVPSQLSDEALAGLSIKPTAELTRLDFESPAAGIRFSADRQWYVTGEDPRVVVLRRVDRGELVAQCNISPVADRSPEKRRTLKEYQNEVRHSLGKHFGRFVRAGEWTDASGQLVYRVVAQGQVDKLPIQWHYYLVANKSGHRAAAAVTVEGEMVERLAAADRELLSTLEVFQPATPAKPQAGNSPTAKQSKTGLQRK